MDIFLFRRRLVQDYADYVRSFISIKDPRIALKVGAELDAGFLWPEPSIGLNPSFAKGPWIDELVDQKLLHPECGRIFRLKQAPADPGIGLRLHQHQFDAILAAERGRNYVLTTGTGSGKSLAYIVPIVDALLKGPRHTGVKAIIVYPMNALANSQEQELQKFLTFGYPDGRGPVSFRRYTGQEKDEERRQILADPPDILLTNYVMLELILTRADEQQLVAAAQNLRFLVLDELHTYRGRQGADVALLVRRTRDACNAAALQHIGTSATLASGSGWEQERREIAQVAARIFGAAVEPEDVITETLERATPEPDLEEPGFRDRLAQRLTAPPSASAPSHPDFIADPLSQWIESEMGLTRDGDRLRRAKPRPVGEENGAARILSELTGVAAETCAAQIERQLLIGSGVKSPQSPFPVFAFRLHQFISRGESVFASVEPESTRYITLQPQTYVPEHRDKLLFPLVFCRECGQEYYIARRTGEEPGGRIAPRSFDDRLEIEDGRAGYLYLSQERPWAGHMEVYPDDWLESTDPPRLKYSLRAKAPALVEVSPDGELGAGGVPARFIPAPFRFCLSCGIAYSGTARSDFAKLGALGSEGRSTATTVLSLSAVRHLRQEGQLPSSARKLLSFTDNRQDASLQAGHFNDFVEVGILRGALFKAAQKAGTGGLRYDVLTQEVFAALGAPLEIYAKEPTVKFAALEATKKALRDVLGYRLYYDLRRGWRIMSPNLEQTGLLVIEYESLADLASDGTEWAGRDPALAALSPQRREAICKALLDHLRRALCMRVDYLDRAFQERLEQASSQYLRAPWAIDEEERLTPASVALPRPQAQNEGGSPWTFLSPRGGFGRYLRRRGTFDVAVSTADIQRITSDLLEALVVGGQAVRVREPEGPGDVAGYQVQAACMRWTAGIGESAAHDPITVPNPPAGGRRPNQFFLNFYRSGAADSHGLEAREHTAQVPYEVRIEREERFREGKLPVLFCSPTMELGVDIASLNVVNLRNVPPTPANYAQRSGRAGRSGQPALVVTYCSTGSPHDQYFFRRPDRMVAGQVAPPRLDLANEDLVRAHVNAIWLAQAGMSLGRSLRDVLDLASAGLELLPAVRADLENPLARAKASGRAQRVLASCAEVASAPWWTPGWLADVHQTLTANFNAACDRWRGLYRAAVAQREAQNRVIADASRPAGDKVQAKRLRAEAESQIELLLATSSLSNQSDFYSYRYFASEGFLPGYSFPRLPISAYIPGRRAKAGTDDFLSRPRFLAVSEFGPGNFVYHEGSRYVINRVLLPVAEAADAGTGRTANTTSAKICATCGYLHAFFAEPAPDLCERCGAPLPPPRRNMFRMQNVTTRRRDRINSDEEERQRKGYEIQTALRFAESSPAPAVRTAEARSGDGELATLTYGHASSIWRINLGWKRRRREGELGFVLDIERGYWGKDDSANDPDDPGDPMSPRTMRVIPFVEDRKNALLLHFSAAMSEAQMASLQAALKHAIQVQFQLEDGELAAEPLPSAAERKALLFYEAAEGGAGVLRRLVEDAAALSSVARQALEICHFEPGTGRDLGHAPGAKERCEAACYDCLMSYYNQPDHPLLDRQAIKDVLAALSEARVEASPTALPRDEQLQALMRQAGSDLERRWLRFLADRGYRLPSDAQPLFEAAGTRPDFFYRDGMVAVYVDGPHHRFAERAARDAEKQARMEDLGYIVVRFADEDRAAWVRLMGEYPSVFGIAAVGKDGGA